MALASCCAADQHGLNGQASMVISTSSQPPPSAALLRLLRHQFGLSESALALGLRQAQQEQAPLPVVLWRFGLISLEQFDALLSWQAQE
jgi:hypothetical protein